MATIRTLLGARLRTRWKSLLALALVGGVALGAAAAAIAVARQTDSSYRRIADSTDAVQFEFSTDVGPLEFESLIAANPDHGLGRVRQWVGFVDVYNSLGIQADSFAPLRDDLAMEELFVFEGRVPIDPDEVFVTDVVVERTGLDIGDRLTRGLISSDFQDVVEHQFVVAGIGTFAAEWGLTDDTRRGPAVIHTTAFAAANQHLYAWHSAGAVREEPPDRGQLVEIFDDAERALPGVRLEVEALSLDKERAARNALRPAVTALYVVGGLGLVAVVAVVSFTLSRELAASSLEHDVLRALGAPHRLRRGLDVGHACAAVLALALIAVPAYVVASSLGPVGEVRRYDPLTWPVFDPGALGLLGVSLMIAAALALALPSRSQAERVSVPADDLAVQLVAGAGSASRRPMVLGLALGAVGLAASAAVVPYVLSLDRLVDDPARYGQAWPAMIRNRWGDQSPEDIAAIAGSELSESVSTISHTNLRAPGGYDLPSIAYEVVEGRDLMTIVEGRGIEARNEAVAGGATLERLELSIGDMLVISPGNPISFNTPSPSGDVRAEVRIVGEAVFPTLTLPGAAVPRLDEGVAISRDLFIELVGPGDEPEVTLVAAANDADILALRAEYPEIADLGIGGNGTTWWVDAQPAEIRSADDALPLLWAGVAVLTLASSAVLGLATRSILRTQQRDMAVLRAIGATRRQILRIAWKQGLILFLPLAIVGIPLGLAGGRLLYARLATDIGVAASPSTPAPAVLAFVVATAACCAVAIVAAARTVQRIPPALSLRTT